MNKKPLEVICVIEEGRQQFWTFESKSKQYIPLDDHYCCRAIPGYSSLSEKEREKARKKHLKSAITIKKIRIPPFLPNVKPKIPDKYPPTPETVLALFGVFDNNRAGVQYLADVLCGAHTRALRKAEPNFRPALLISSDAPEIIQIFTSVMRAFFPTISWPGEHGTNIKISHIMDYRVKTGEFPHHFGDFSSGKVKIKHHKKFRFPYSYADSTVLVIGANAAQIREATPYLENAAVILVNSVSADLNPTKIPASSLAAYDPAVIEQLEAEHHGVASLLHWWWSLFEDEDTWARQIIQKARASFGPPDARYIRVEFDPKKLRDAIRYQVLLSFFDEIEDAEFMTTEALAPYRQSAKEVFDPAPPEPVRLRHAEDQDVFREILWNWVKNSTTSIIPDGERFVKKDKPLAAWRTIADERYLVFLEDTWAKAYAKAVRAKKDIDTSFFQREHWERELQKILCEKGLIKSPSAGFRYRYDLLQNGTRDSTYVVAVPAHLLES